MWNSWRRLGARYACAARGETMGRCVSSTGTKTATWYRLAQQKMYKWLLQNSVLAVKSFSSLRDCPSPSPFSMAYDICNYSSSRRFQYMHATLRKYQHILHFYSVYWGLMKITIICYLHIRSFCITGHVYRWQQQSFP